MAGTFAHITMVGSICRDRDVLDQIGSLDDETKSLLQMNLNFVELGSVSPDYPLLHMGGKGDIGWGNIMHYCFTADIIREAINWILGKKTEGVNVDKATAWLFGYVSHVVTDMTIHPVVNEKVGEYAANADKHRICEMNQDSYIYNEVFKAEITEAEHIQAGIAHCDDPSDHSKIHPQVVEIWTHSLRAAVPNPSIMSSEHKQPEGDPVPNEWHGWFMRMVDKGAEEGGRLPSTLWGLAEEYGYSYPALANVDYQYIYDLETPDGKTKGYREIFEMTRANVISAWDRLGKSLLGNARAFDFANGNLDTGQTDDGKMLYWDAKTAIESTSGGKQSKVGWLTRARNGLVAGVTALALVIGIFVVNLLPEQGPHKAEGLVVPLSNMTTYIQGIITMPDFDKSLSNDEVLEIAMSSGHGYREAFANVRVMLWKNQRDVVILVCSPDGKEMWLEDSSKEPGVERRHYETPGPQKVGFTLIAPDP